MSGGWSKREADSFAVAHSRALVQLGAATDDAGLMVVGCAAALDAEPTLDAAFHGTSRRDDD